MHQPRLFRIFAIIACAIVIVFCALQMQALPLWSILPLPLLLAIWWLVVLLRLPRYAPHRLALATLSGALLTFGFPVFPTTFLLFFAFVPLLIIEKEIREDEGKKDNLFRYAYHAFVLWNIGSTWWVSNASLLPGIIANFLNAVFMAATFWGFHRLTNATVLSKWRYLIFVLVWVAFEHFHQSVWEISWCWLTLGNAFGANPAWVQWYEWTGTLGGSVWILALNVLAFQLWTQYQNRDEQRGTIVAAILSLLIPLSVSLYLGGKARKIIEDAPKQLSMVTTQPDFEPHYTRLSLSEQQQLEKLLELSAPQLDSMTDYLLFPEATFDLRDVSQMPNHSTVQRLQLFLQKYPRLQILTGIDAYRVFRPDETSTDATRTQLQPDGNLFRYEVYNAATQIHALDTASFMANQMPLHKKGKFVPGAEKIPYRTLFFFVEPIVAKFGGSFAGYGSDEQPTIFVGSKANAAPVVCYESIYGDYCRQYLRPPHGADFFAIVTNDGWWDNTEGHRQHRMFSQLRAIELRRPVVRSAIMGNACFINALGEVTAQGSYGNATALKGKVKIASTKFGQTYYARWGDWIGKFAFYAVLGLIVVNFFIFLRKIFVKI